MRRNRALYLAILLLLALSGAVHAETPSEWDDGSAMPAEAADFGPGEAADLKVELDAQLRAVRDRRARIDVGQAGVRSADRVDALARELLENEVRLLVASAAIAEVVDGAVHDPAEVAMRVDQALAAFAASLFVAGDPV